MIKGKALIAIHLAILLAFFGVGLITGLCVRADEVVEAEKETKLYKGKLSQATKENLKLHTPLITLNTMVSNCWSCNRNKQQDTTLQQQILEIGQRN
jgi:hypothetical protein